MPDSTPPAASDWAAFAGPNPPGSVPPPPTATPGVAAPAKKRPQVPNATGPLSASDATLAALMQADLENARASGSSSSTTPTKLADLRRQILEDYGDEGRARELLSVLDIFEAFNVHLETLIGEFDRGFGQVIDTAEPLARRLSLHSTSLKSGEDKLEEINRLLAVATGNQERLLKRFEEIEKTFASQTLVLDASVRSARQGGPLAKVFAALLPMVTFLLGGVVLYYMLVWMR